jgi:serine phosphatase RsbU (regulator of sigma subunit)
VLETVRACRHLPASQIVESVYEAVREFAQNAPQLDDITLVAIKVKSGPAATEMPPPEP